MKRLPFLVLVLAVLALFIAPADAQIGFGGNVGSGVEASWTSYISGRHAAGWSKVVVATIPVDANYAPGSGNDNNRLAASAWLRSNWASLGYDGLVDLDADAIFGSYANMLAGTWTQDNVHPTVAGAARLAALFSAVVNGLHL